MTAKNRRCGTSHVTKMYNVETKISKTAFKNRENILKSSVDVAGKLFQREAEQLDKHKQCGNSLPIE